LLRIIARSAISGKDAHLTERFLGLVGVFRDIGCRSSGERGGVDVAPVLLNIIGVCGKWNPAELRVFDLAVDGAALVVFHVSDLHHAILKNRVVMTRPVLNM
jgi:hypothetical protein